jgi:hypothetical protein
MMPGEREMGTRKKIGAALVLVAAAVAALAVWSRPDPEARLAWLDHHAFRNDPAARFDPTLGFRLKESVSMYGFRHNAAGLVGPEIGPKTPGTVRVACLGGSTTLGAGVEIDAYSYPALLQAMFDLATCGQRRVEVLNAGVFGYHSLHTPLRVAELAALSPDVYVVMDGLNDLDAVRSLPQTVLERARLGGLPAAARDLGRYLAGDGSREAASLPGLHDLEAKWRLADMAGNLSQAASLARRQGAAMLLVSDPLRLEPVPSGTDAARSEQARLLAFGAVALPAAAAAASAGRPGVALLDVQPVFADALADAAKTRRVWADGLHLTRYGNFLLAREVFGALAARKPVADALAGCPMPDARTLETAFPACLTWRPADGSGLPQKTDGAAHLVSVAGLKDGPVDQAGWSSLRVVDPGKPGEAVLHVSSGARQMRVYPRIEGPADEVAVLAEGPDGARSELFAMRKAFADGVWSAQGEWYRVVLPEGEGWRIVVRLSGDNAQLFHRGEAALFPLD